MHVFTFVLIYVVLNVSATSKGEELIKSEAIDEISKENGFNKCLSLIIKENIPCNAFISFVYSVTDGAPIIKTMSKDKCYSVIIRTFESKTWVIHNNFYIIMAETYIELLIGLLEMRRDLLWNPTAKFIIATKDIDDTFIEDIFEELLTFKIYNIIFLNRIEDNNTLIYTYFPSRDGNCGDGIDEIVNLGNCLENNSSKLIPQIDFKKSRNCILRAVKFQEKPRTIVPGKPDVIIPIVEQFVLETYAQYSNFTVDFKVIKTEIDFGIVYPNGTVTGLLNYLDKNIADIAVGSTVIIMNRAGLFDYIYGFNYASFKLYTSALGSEMWKKVYKEFDLQTYSIILCFYCLFIMVCIFFLNTEPKIPHSRIYLIIKLWGFFYLGNGTAPYPNNRRLRSVTLCWIWFTFFISSFYNSDMYSLITGHVQRVREIEPNKLASIPYKPCIPKVMRTFFHYAYNEDLPESFDPVACYSIDGSLDTTADGNDLYTVQMKPSYTEREIEFIDEEGNRKLDSWDFGSDILLGFYINKGSPFRSTLLAHAQYMFETGLVNNYKEHMSPPKGAIPRRKKGVSKPFVLDDFRIHFAVLFVGSFISAFTFFIEIIYNKKTRTGKRFTFN